jgi:hypothetical protein
MPAAQLRRDFAAFAERVEQRLNDRPAPLAPTVNVTAPPIELTVNVDAKRGPFKAKATRDAQGNLVMETVE